MRETSKVVELSPRERWEITALAAQKLRRLYEIEHAASFVDMTKEWHEEHKFWTGLRDKAGTELDAVELENGLRAATGG